jgi:spermidine synthase
MVPWQLLDRASVPGGRGTLTLHRRGAEFSIRIDGSELMNSRAYASEDALSELGCARIETRKRARVLIGGLGMGYSLRTALDALAKDAEIVVAELVPEVVEWNRTYLGHLAGHPLRDRRVVLRNEDVGLVIRERSAAFDAILLDVDNGPDGLTRRSNDWLYGAAGLAAAHAALRTRGVLGVWSARPDTAFLRRMRAARFDVDQVAVTARGHGRGARHVDWIGVRQS